VIFAEILDRRGHVQQRVRIERLPCVVGRAYTSDVVVDDPWVSPQHLVVELDPAGLLARDLGSTNGLFEVAPARRVGEARGEHELLLRIGRTTLRLRDGSCPVEPARPDVLRGPLRRWLGSHWTALPVLAAGVVTLRVLQNRASSPAELGAAAVAGEEIFVLLAMALWAGGWALAGRLLSHQARFVAHWSITCAAVLFGLVHTEATRLLEFLVAPVTPVQLASSAAESAILGAALFAHLSVLGAGSPALRGLVTGALALAVLVISALEERGAQDWVETLPYWSTLQPLDPRWLPRESPEEFFAGARALEAELDALAQEED
jgi:hypothetical protein